MSKEKHLINVKKLKKKNYLTKYLSRGSSDPVSVTLTTNKYSGSLNSVELQKAFSNFKKKLQSHSEDVWGCYKMEFNRSGNESINFVAGGNDIPSANWMKNVWNYCVNKAKGDK